MQALWVRLGILIYSHLNGKQLKHFKQGNIF